MDLRQDEILNDKITIPVELIKYFSEDKKTTNNNKYTKVKAFYDLLIRHIQSTRLDEDFTLNYTELSKCWTWSKPYVASYIEKLKYFGIIRIEKVINNKLTVVMPQTFVLREQKTSKQE